MRSRIVSLGFFCVLVSACGGGGGGGGTTTPTMTTPTAPPFALTAASTGAPPVAVTLSLTDRDASGGLTAGDVVTVENAECGGLRRQITLTISRMTAGLDQVEGRVDLDISVDPPGMRVIGSFDVARGWFHCHHRIAFGRSRARVSGAMYLTR